MMGRWHNTEAYATPPISGINFIRRFLTGGIRRSPILVCFCPPHLLFLYVPGAALCASAVKDQAVNGLAWSVARQKAAVLNLLAFLPNACNWVDDRHIVDHLMLVRLNVGLPFPVLNAVRCVVDEIGILERIRGCDMNLAWRTSPIGAWVTLFCARKTTGNGFCTTCSPEPLMV